MSKSKSSIRAAAAALIKESKNKILIAFLNILCLSVFIYVVMLHLLGSADHIEIERAGLEARREIMNLTVYIFRNEEIIYADSVGIGAAYLLENGEKAARNQAVARINPNMRDDIADSVRIEIEALERQIDILRRSNINLEFATASIQRVNSDSHDLYIEMLGSVRNNRMGDMSRRRDSMLVLLNKRQLIVGDADNFNGIINTLSERKRELEAQAVFLNAGESGRNIYARRSGIFYRRADGYENYFTGEAVSALNLAKFEELTSRAPNADILNRAIGKLAYDYRWHFVGRTSRSALEGVNLIEGRPYNIIFPYSSNMSIPFTFRSRISEPNSDDVLLVFETTVIPVDFYFLRRQTVQIVLREVSGLRVPDDAIVVREVSRRWEESEDGVMREIVEIIENPEAMEGELILGETVKGVYILHGREVIFRQLDGRDRIAEFDGYALYAVGEARAQGSTTALQMNEDIIISGRNLFTGRIIG